MGYATNTINLFLFKKKKRVKFNEICLWLIAIYNDYYLFHIFRPEFYISKDRFFFIETDLSTMFIFVKE